MDQTTKEPSLRNSHFVERLKELVKTLPPAYFAMVMSTGIISISCSLLEMNWLAHAMFWLNLLLYPALWLLTILRVVFYPREVARDMIEHQRGPGCFTMVAGSCILGSQFIIIFGNYSAAFALWIVGLVLWVVFNYTIFTGFTVKENKPTLDEGISGSWLLAVVATQSIAVLSTLIAAHMDQPYKLEVNFLALCMWLWGGMLYIWMISLIFYRYTFFKFSPDDLSPPYWINMGAMAISTLAGSLLISNTHDAPFLQSIVPFIKGFTIFYWVTGTWWIPMLFILAIWRHVYKRFPMKYDPLYWGAVFPLGMYTACTFRMADAMNIHFLDHIPKFFIYIALAAWLATFIGFLHSVFIQFKKLVKVYC